jgi:hypothetical protein
MWFVSLKIVIVSFKLKMSSDIWEFILKVKVQVGAGAVN